MSIKNNFSFKIYKKIVLYNLISISYLLDLLELKLK